MLLLCEKGVDDSFGEVVKKSPLSGLQNYSSLLCVDVEITISDHRTRAVSRVTVLCPSVTI